MSHSNSSLNCFMDCPAKYNLHYIKRIPSPAKPSPHLVFGSMAHEVLEKAGQLRDHCNLGLVEPGEYHTIIPSEVLYPNLKTEFQISSWQRYFMAVIKQTSIYEKECYDELQDESGLEPIIEREVKIQIPPELLGELGYGPCKQAVVGVIDLLLYTPTHAIILDYKFSVNRKSQDDFDLDSQLPLYAFLVHLQYDIPLHNIQYGYIDIPKQDFGKPTLLSNGTLSRSKSQNLSQDMYKKAVDAIHKGDAYYNCEPGGYYHDCYCALALNKPAYLSKQYADLDIVHNIAYDIMQEAKLIDYMQEHKLPFVRKYGAYNCKSCEYLSICKPWLGLEDKFK